MSFVYRLTRLLAVTFLAGTIVLPALAASTQLWTVQSQSDFKAGTPEHVALSTLGELRLAPSITEIAQTDEPYVWSVARDSAGNLYAGTGNGGRIYRVDAEGNVTSFVNTPEIAILSLAVGPDGALYAGTSPDGLIYRIDLSQEKPTPETIFQDEEMYVWALLFDPSGILYAATGENGKLFKIIPDPDKPGAFTHELLFDADQSHLLSLTEHDGQLYAGSDGDGLVYRIDPNAPGKAFVVHDTDENEVRSLIMREDGTLYASTATGQLPRPQGPGFPTPPRERQEIDSFVYRISPAGIVRRIWKSGDGMILSMALYGDRVLVGTGDEGRLFTVADDGSANLLGKVSEAQVVEILADEDGYVLATGNSGKLFRMGRTVAESGTWESDPFDAGIVSRWGNVRWEGETPPGTAIKIKTRSGNTETPDSTWSEWSEDNTQSDGSKVASPTARFLQMTATLTTSDPAVTPVVRLIETAYLQANVPPEIDSITVEAARDEGPRNDKNSDDPPQTKRTVKWNAQDANHDDLEYALFFKAESETTWHLIKDELKKPTYTWDAAPMPDGDYRVKVVASDRPSNPPDRALSTSLISEPFRMDTSQPVIADLAATRSPDGSVKVSFTATDGTSYLSKAAYALDADDWRLVFPTDAIFDSRTEAFEFTIPKVSEGTHSVAIQASDMAGNMATARVRIP